MPMPQRNQVFTKQKLNKDTLKRLLKYITVDYKKTLIFVVICIILSSIAGVTASVFIEILIDDYITPLLGVENPEFGGLLKIILVMAIIYLIGVFANFAYNRKMIKISQGVLKKIRDEMFEKMQHLPIKYFDTHTHGDIMSRYTNDIDTLSHMIAQTIPQVFSSAITIVTVFVSMVITNIYLTLVVMISLGFIFLAATGILTGFVSFFILEVYPKKSITKTNKTPITVTTFLFDDSFIDLYFLR